MVNAIEPRVNAIDAQGIDVRSFAQRQWSAGALSTKF
jgi:hypothetical protein